jgi:hypothetical protein
MNGGSVSHSNVFAIFYGVKVLRLIYTYSALLIAKNYTSQIYMEKVLVKGENPPHLSNLLHIFILIEIGIMSIFLLLFYGVDATFKLGFAEKELFSSMLIPDYLISLLFIYVYGKIVSTSMSKKKYFLYKEDGLRAIRAYTELLFSITLVNALIPWNALMSGIIFQALKFVSAKMKKISPS